MHLLILCRKEQDQILDVHSPHLYWQIMCSLQSIPGGKGTIAACCSSYFPCDCSSRHSAQSVQQWYLADFTPIDI